MSFQNSYGPDGSININVVPSFGRIVQLPEQQKVVTVKNNWFRLVKLMHGELAKAPWEPDHKILIPQDMFHSAHEK